MIGVGKEIAMKKQDKLISSIRRSLSDVQNDVVDNVIKHRLDRRSLLLHGSRLGVSLPALTMLSGALGVGSVESARASGVSGGTLRIAITTPPGDIDPVTYDSNAQLMIAMQSGEYLCALDPDYVLRPVLATSWSSNKDGTVWTFKLRPGVKFNNGEPMNADAVISSVNRLADPKNGSSALSVFRGLLSPGNTIKVDDLTVAFHLDKPYGNFPYAVSSDNYNLIILPASYTSGFQNSFVGTGPFKIEKYIPKVGCSFVRNESYWGQKALLDRVEFSFYNDIQSQVLALQGGQVDMLAEMSVIAGRAILNNPNFKVVACRSNFTSQMHMRCDVGPFKDKRVRQALALTLNRPEIVKGLFEGYAAVGNDSPFAPVFPSTNLNVPQRVQDIEKAKSLLTQAGVGSSFSVTLTTEQYLEIPDYAVLVKSFAQQAGININLNVEPQNAYYGKAVFGQSDWLDSPLGITDYGPRGVPNVVLRSALTSNGAWNAAHFKNPAFDKLVGQYDMALDLSSQHVASGEIEQLLLDETPIVVSYFYKSLYATAKNVSGLPACTERLYLQTVSIS